MRKAKLWWILFVLSAGFFVLIWNLLDPARGLQTQIPDMLINVYPLSLLIAVPSFLIALVMTLRKVFGKSKQIKGNLTLKESAKLIHIESEKRAKIDENNAGSLYNYAIWVLRDSQYLTNTTPSTNKGKHHFDEQTINRACKCFIKAHKMDYESAWWDLGGDGLTEYKRAGWLKNLQIIDDYVKEIKPTFRSRIAAEEKENMESALINYSNKKDNRSAAEYLSFRISYLGAASDAYLDKENWEDYLFESADPKIDLEYAICLYALNFEHFKDFEYDHSTSKIISPYRDWYLSITQGDSDDTEYEDADIMHMKEWEMLADRLNKFVEKGYRDIEIVFKHTVEASDLEIGFKHERLTEYISSASNIKSEAYNKLSKAYNHSDKNEFADILDSAWKLETELPSDREERLLRFSEQYDRQKEEDAHKAKINAAIASNFTMDGFGSKALSSLESKYGSSSVGRPSGGSSSSSSGGSSSSSPDGTNPLFMAGGAEGDSIKDAGSNIAGRHEGGVYKDASGTPRGRLVNGMYQDEHGNTIGWQAGTVILDAQSNQIGRIEGGVIKNANSETIGRVE
ncbi:MAG: hypothetical protein FWC77_06055 [Defluviitaleaceae bacterium]|nr:hypothetical protein [Defluviitaleaceae bacterium]